MQAQPNTLPPLMSFSAVSGKLARRQRAAQLLLAVIDESIEPRLAINRWPEAVDEPDVSLECAYLALWHFEADEEKQKTELFYMDAQLELLRQIAKQLTEGKDLPPYILTLYKRKPHVRFFYSLSPWRDLFRQAQREWGRFLTFWQGVINLSRNN